MPNKESRLKVRNGWSNHQGLLKSTLPNISTNDVYYRRQLCFHSLNIHVLSNKQSVFYTDDETVCVFMLFHFITEILDQTVRELIIFCDSCAGQNKNYTAIHFLHHLICEVKHFASDKMVSPLRGHSYLDCDKNLGLINQKSHAEIPENWRVVLRNSRTKLSPFNTGVSF